MRLPIRRPGSTVTITASAVDERRVAVSVADEGPGVTTRAGGGGQRIFREVRYAWDVTMTGGKDGGSGLGLYILAPPCRGDGRQPDGSGAPMAAGRCSGWNCPLRNAP